MTFAYEPIHSGAGIPKGTGTYFRNVSNCDVQYNPVNPVVTFEI
jgi:hypothetical protein